eukprot:Nk52_evm7s260 gene=Nk52_evmTU7s260
MSPAVTLLIVALSASIQMGVEAQTERDIIENGIENPSSLSFSDFEVDLDLEYISFDTKKHFDVVGVSGSGSGSGSNSSGGKDKFTPSTPANVVQPQIVAVTEDSDNGKAVEGDNSNKQLSFLVQANNPNSSPSENTRQSLFTTIAWMIFVSSLL